MSVVGIVGETLKQFARRPADVADTFAMVTRSIAL
jgi:hypothetical protein